MTISQEDRPTIIDNEGVARPMEVCDAMRHAIAAIERNEDVNVIVMYTSPTEDPDESRVDLFVHSLTHTPILGMTQLLQDWVVKNVPMQTDPN